MFAICEKLHFSFNTIHLSISYLDSLLSAEPIPGYQHQLYAITSILIAAKAIELDSKIPFISKLLSVSSNLFKADELRRIEHKILAFFAWDLQLPTIIDMLEYYLSQGVVFSSDFLETYQDNKENGPLKEKNSNELEENKAARNQDSATFSANFLVKVAEKELGNLTLSQENLGLAALKEENLYAIIKEIENMIYRLSNHILRGILSEIS